jgi:hypothetical protein
MPRIFAVSAATVAMMAAIPLAADDPGREFNGTAVVRTSRDTRRMPVTLVANRFTSVEEARQLAVVLQEGGQGSLLAALTGRNDGQLRLGALSLPIALVVAEETGNGYRYVFLSHRRIQVEETTFGEESLDYPFGIAVFEMEGFGRGSGSLHVAAALSIDADGRLEVDDYDGADGTLDEIEIIR